VSAFYAQIREASRRLDGFVVRTAAVPEMFKLLEIDRLLSSKSTALR